MHPLSFIVYWQSAKMLLSVVNSRSSDHLIKMGQRYGKFVKKCAIVIKLSCESNLLILNQSCYKLSFSTKSMSEITFKTNIKTNHHPFNIKFI